MNNNFRENKYLKLITLGIFFLVILAAAIFTFVSRTHQNMKTVIVYYQPQSERIKVTKTAVLRGKDAEKIKAFLNGLKFYSDVDDTLSDINTPTYRIEENHENSSSLDFNYHIYVRKDHYIVMDAYKGQYALVYLKNYDFLNLFLSDGNLSTFPSGPTYP